MKGKATMKDIAAALGISINAVSLALNDHKGVSEETRIQVLETANSIGYLDKNVRYSRTFGYHHISVLIQDIYVNEMDFYGEILYTIIKEAKKSGYDILVQHFNDDDMAIHSSITSRRVSGIIILGKISTSNVEKLLALGIHIVIIDHAPRFHNINCILTDNISGGFMATTHLIHGGFTKIGFCGDLSYSISVKERYYGFLEALILKGIIKTNQISIYTGKYSITGKIQPLIIANDINGLDKVVSKRREFPQAFFCCNDAVAFALINVLKDRGVRIPADISIVGFDNCLLAEKSNPKLTTINVNRELMGQKAVRRLIRLIEQEDAEVERTVLGVKLVERDSVKPLVRTVQD